MIVGTLLAVVLAAVVTFAVRGGDSTSCTPVSTALRTERALELRDELEPYLTNPLFAYLDDPALGMPSPIWVVALSERFDTQGGEAFGTTS